MNNDWFFEKFALIADAPGAVATMRGLILELAVNGRLTLQASGNNLSKVRLDSLGDWAQGCGFPTSEQGHKDREILFAKVSDMNLLENTREITITNNTIDIETVKRLRIKVHPPGTVIFPKIGGAIATNKRRILVKPTAIDNNCSGIIPSRSCETTWLFIVLSAIDFSSYQSGTSVPSVNQSALGEIEVFLPPLAEQKRIVAKVDELMGICDALEAQQQERELRKSVLVRSSLSRFAEAPTPENLGYLFHKSYDIPPSELRKSILTLAIQGKLVPQDPNDETARHIVEKLAITRMQYTPAKHVKNTAKLCDADDNRYIYDIPSSWTWCRFGDLVLDFRYGTSRKCDRNSGGVPVLRIPNIQNGRVDSTDLKFTSMPSAEFAELRLQADDILLVRSNGSEALVGKSAVVCSEDERFAYAGYLVRARIPKKEVFSKYLHVALSARVVRDQIEGPIRTTSGVKNINTKELSNLALPLPPLAEQHRIVAKVDQLMALVDELERQQDASRENATTLLDAIVQEMTSGGRNIAATLES
jgi:type I restriction enzyme S subunit